MNWWTPWNWLWVFTEHFSDSPLFVLFHKLSIFIHSFIHQPIYHRQYIILEIGSLVKQHTGILYVDVSKAVGITGKKA